MSIINIGNIVKASYNSGIYIGKVIEDRGNFYLVEVLAVEKHPKQGDLHHPGEVENVAFHERKALAFHEKMNARKRTTQLYHGEIPNYNHSLKQAVEELKADLSLVDTLYNQKALEKIDDLEEHFYKKTNY
jgi:kinase-associated protein B